MARMSDSATPQALVPATDGGKRTVRTASLADASALADLESSCFPPAEAATYEQFVERLSHYGDHFWLLYVGDQLVSCVNGFLTNSTVLTDEMFEDASMHNPAGTWQMIFGVLTHPDHQGHGYAHQLLSHVIDETETAGRSGPILTCKRELIPFYESLGFELEGESPSVHGGATWYQMRRSFPRA
ncbi:GNAT family N-acetyltransferase [Corynebacterium pyruviciproducens]|nr:GNAT family N-acetyltransferase [Corynebacterium pyruviciproducens]